ncbi:MAG: prepilin peptidase [Thalassovita sp.]
MTLLDSHFYLLLVLIGPFIGSFLGVLVDRLPRGQNVVHGRSACRYCKARLGVVDLVPILSFVWLNGACRHCGAKIPPWLLYQEIAAAGIAVLAVLAAPTVGLAWAWAGFLWVLLALAVCDLTRFRLPDVLNAALLLLALLLALMPLGHGLEFALWGAGAGAGSFALLRWGYHALRGQHGLGFGDVKLMAGLGAWAGPLDLPVLVLIAAVGALAIALVSERWHGAGSAKPFRTRALPFGAALCAAAGVLWLLRVLGVMPV